MGQGCTNWDPTGGRGRSGQGRPPFGDTVITAWHLDRPAVAEVLDMLEWDVLRARRSGAIVAPAGLGRTHLLRIVAERINPVQWESVYVPSCAMDFEALSRFIVGLLDGKIEPAGGQGAAELERRLHELWVEGRSLLLLVDDAEAMPTETLRQLLELAELKSPTLVVLFALTVDEAAENEGGAAIEEGTESGHRVELEDGAETSAEREVTDAVREAAGSHEGAARGAGRLAEWFASRPVARLEEPMTEAESGEYLSHRLQRAGASPEIVERFTTEVVSQLHALSGGLPVQLHTLAQILVETPAARASEAWSEFLRDDRGVLEWLGSGAGDESDEDDGADAEADLAAEAGLMRRVRRRRRRASA